MEKAGKVVQFSGTRQKTKRDQSHKITNTDGIKYFNQQQIKLLSRTVRDQAALDIDRNQVAAIREWMAIDLNTSCGPGLTDTAADLSCYRRAVPY